MSSNVIALDGPAASGKSSVSKLLSLKLGIACVNTGSFYRALGWKLLRSGKHAEDYDEISIRPVLEKTVIAYEPIWSIGTGKNASQAIAEDICGFIRETIKELYGEATAEEIRILYGGSVKPNNIKEYLSSPNIDGALVGGASLQIQSYRDLLNNIIQ